MTFFRGADAIVLAVDATRKESLEYAVQEREMLIKDFGYGHLPFAFFLTKMDVSSKLREVSVNELVAIDPNIPVYSMSAKDNFGIEKAFIY